MVVTTSKLLPDAIRYCPQRPLLDTATLAAAHRGTLYPTPIHLEALSPLNLATCKSSLVIAALPCTQDRSFLVGGDCGAVVVNVPPSAPDNGTSVTVVKKWTDSRVYSVSVQDDQVLVGLGGGMVIAGGRGKVRVLSEGGSEDQPVRLASLNLSKTALIGSDRRGCFQLSAVKPDGLMALHSNSQRMMPGCFGEAVVAYGDFAWSATSQHYWAGSSETRSGRSLAIHDLRLSHRDPVISYTIPRRRGGCGAHQICWNPFIPYWLGSLTPNGTIGIFDLRYSSGGPMLELSEHSQTSTFAWSNSHVELLMSASTDRSISQWSLLLESLPSPASSLVSLNDTAKLAGIPHRLAHRSAVVVDGGGGGEVEDATMGGGATIRALLPSDSRLDTFHGLTLTGGLLRVSYQIQDSPKGLLDSFEAIEDGLYARRFDRVYPALLHLSNSLETMTEFGRLQDLTNRTFPSLPIPPDSWRIGDGKAAAAAADAGFPLFMADLERFSRTLPPGFEVKRFVTADQMLHQNAVANVRLKVLLLDLVERRDLVAIQVFLPKLIGAMAINPTFLQPSLLHGLIRVLLEHDRLLGLKFVHELVGRICPTRLDNGACGLVHLVLYPTIYDADVDTVEVFYAQASLWQQQVQRFTTKKGMDQQHSSHHSNQHQSNQQKLKTASEDDLLPPPPPTAQPNIKKDRKRLPKVLLPKSPLVDGHNDDPRMVELRRCLRSQKHTMELLNLEISYETILRETPSGLSEWIFKTFQAGGGRLTTVSSRPLFTYLHLTLHHGLFGEYFELAGHLVGQTTDHHHHYQQQQQNQLQQRDKDRAVKGKEGDPPVTIDQVIIEHAKAVAFPRLQYVLAQASDPLRPQLALKATSLIIRIAINGIQPIPTFLLALLTERFRSLTRTCLAYIDAPGSPMSSSASASSSSSQQQSSSSALDELRAVLAAIPRPSKADDRWWRRNELLREILALRARLVVTSPVVTSPK